jgi:fructuronate reductase
MLTLKDWQNHLPELKAKKVDFPHFDVQAVKQAGKEQPIWIHFGGGNLYRAFHSQIAQTLANLGKLSCGPVVVETFSHYTIDNVYKPYNNDFLQVVMAADGSLHECVCAVTADALFANLKRPKDFECVQQMFESPKLQLATFTITEKGYSLIDGEGKLLPFVQREIAAGPQKPASTMGTVASLLYARFRAGAYPIALASTDNFSRNGERFRTEVLRIVTGWHKNKLVNQDFVDYVSDESRVSFPWSMIDRITPNPSEDILEKLRAQGWSDLSLKSSPSGTHFAGFSNTEQAHYLVMEDNFPNGRPKFEDAGVIMCDRETAEKADTMKVTACLNPLHTCLAIYGCLLGYKRIWQEMEDPDLVSLIHHLGYNEDLPVVTDPKVINPREFIDELLTQRLPNKALPDAPQRIATDTSQKIPIRYGHTLNAYLKAGKDVTQLTYIPLVIAGWLRYLIAKDDKGSDFTPSPDPLLPMLQDQMHTVTLGCQDSATIHAAVEPICSNKTIFSCDLYEIGLGPKIERMLKEELVGPGAVRKTIERYI